MSAKIKKITYSNKKIPIFFDMPLNFNFFTEKKFIFSEYNYIFYSNDDEIKVIEAHEKFIYHLVIDKNQDIISCSGDKTIKKFKVEKNQEILIFKSDIIFKKIILFKNSKYGLFDIKNNFYIFNSKTSQIETKIKNLEDIDLIMPLISFYFQYKNEFLFFDKNTFINKYSIIKKNMKNIKINVNKEKKYIFLIYPKEIEDEDKDKLENIEYFEFVKIDKDKEKSINIKVKIGKIYEPFRCDSYYYDKDENIIYFTFLLNPPNQGCSNIEKNKYPFLYIGKVLVSENSELYTKEVGSDGYGYSYQIFKMGKKLVLVKINEYYMWKCEIIDCDSGYEKLKEFKVIPE